MKFALTVLALVMLAACSTVERGRVFQPTTLANARLFYVTRPADADGDIDKHIEAAIAMHGKRVSGGPAVAAPSSAHIRGRLGHGRLGSG